MEHVKLFEEFLFELGGGSAKPYRVTLKKKRSPDLAYYEYYTVFFKTESGLKYSLVVKNLLKYLYVDFGLEEEERYPDAVNRGEMWRIMATIKKVVEKVWKATSDLKGITYNPKASDNDLQDMKGEKRDRLYRLMISSFAKDNGMTVEFQEIGGGIYAHLT